MADVAAFLLPGLRKGIVVLVLVMLPRLAMAQGGPPLLTDDPGTPGNGHAELNIAMTLEKPRGESLYEAPLIDFNYGVGERMQVKFEIPWLVENATSEETQTGSGNLLLGFKWRFLDENPDGADVSVYPQFDFNTTEHSTRSGLVPKGMELFLPLEIAKDLGAVALNVELGYLLQEEREGEWVLGVALGRHVSEAVEVLGELHADAARDFEHGILVWNLGARLKLSDLNSVLVSAGRGVRGESRGEPGFIGYLGLQFNF